MFVVAKAVELEVEKPLTNVSPFRVLVVKLAKLSEDEEDVAYIDSAAAAVGVVVVVVVMAESTAIDED